jgi:hypothetical protein
MFGTLLAYETADLGVLYQPSCPMLPSLLVSALHCFFFTILDIFWMLLTFFGMRRRLIFPRGGGTLNELNPIRRTFGAYFGNTRTGGNVALLWALGSHLVAAAVTTTNQFQYGCAMSLSLLPVVTAVVMYAYWSGASKIYMPQPNSSARLSLPVSFSYGGGAIDEDEDADDNNNNNNEEEEEAAAAPAGDNSNNGPTQESRTVASVAESKASVADSKTSSITYHSF